ncbi:MAG: HAD-IA family hydrolase [Verrucomicrobia bacterium]|nr:HAD-IA family hydrolase [Verrucomicrobiota bacterium]
MIRSGRIQAVTFDVGGTLIDPWPSVGDVYAEVAKQHGLRETDPQVLNRRFAEAWRAKTNFDYSRRAWAEIVAQTFYGPSAVGEETAFFADLYDRFAEPDVVRIYDDVVPALDKLRARGLRLGVISNWDERLRPLLHALDLDRFFEVVVVSGELGQHKPAPPIFEHALQQLRLSGDAVLHVGDSVLEDVMGAEQSGLRAVRLDRNASSSTPEIIRSLADLPILE